MRERVEVRKISSISFQGVIHAQTPVMVTGIADRMWSITDLLEE